MSLDNQTVDPQVDAPDAATVQAESAQQQPQTRKRRQNTRSLLDWRPDDAVTMTTQELEICSPLLRRNVNRMGIRAQLSFYLLQRVLPSSGLVEEAQRFEEAFGEKIVALETEIEMANEELRLLARKDGIETLPNKSSTAPMVLSVPIYTPGMHRFVRLMRNLDSYYCALDYLWMNGLVATDYQWDRINHFRRRLWEEIQFLNRSWQHARAVLRDFQEGRRAARPARNGEATAQPAEPEAA